MKLLTVKNNQSPTKGLSNLSVEVLSKASLLWVDFPHDLVKVQANDYGTVGDRVTCSSRQIGLILYVFM